MNIYIGNLSYEVKESEVKQLLEEYGTVDSIKLIMDRNTGRPKGFGFVEMNNDEEAKKAIQELNGRDYLGRPISIKEAIPKY